MADSVSSTYPSPNIFQRLLGLGGTSQAAQATLKPRIKKAKAAAESRTEEYLAQMGEKATWAPWNETLGWVFKMAKKDADTARSINLYIGKKRGLDEGALLESLVPSNVSPEDQAILRGYLSNQLGVLSQVKEDTVKEWGRSLGRDKAWQKVSRDLPLSPGEMTTLKEVFDEEAEKWVEGAKKNLGSATAPYRLKVRPSDLMPWNWGKFAANSAQRLLGQKIWNEAMKRAYPELQMFDGDVNYQTKQLKEKLESLDIGVKGIELNVSSAKLLADRAKIPERSVLEFNERQDIDFLSNKLREIGGNREVASLEDKEAMLAAFRQYVNAGKISEADLSGSILPRVERRFRIQDSLGELDQFERELKRLGISDFSAEYLQKVLDQLGGDKEAGEHLLSLLKEVRSRLKVEIGKRDRFIAKWFGPKDLEEGLFGDRSRIWAWRKMLKDPWGYLKRELIWKQIKLPGGKKIGLNLKGRISDAIKSLLEKMGFETKGLSGVWQKITTDLFRSFSKVVLKGVNVAAKKVGATLFETGGVAATGGVVATGTGAAAAPAAGGGCLATLTTSEFWGPILAGCGCVVAFILLAVVVIIIIVAAMKDYKDLDLPFGAAARGKGTRVSETAGFPGKTDNGEMSIDKVSSTYKPKAGDTITYTITIDYKEAFETLPDQIMVTDTFSGVGLDEETFSANPAPLSSNCAADVCTASWTLGSAKPGDKITITATVKVSADYGPDTSGNSPPIADTAKVVVSAGGVELDSAAIENIINAPEGMSPNRSPSEEGCISSHFGENRTTHQHEGVDIAINSGTPVYSPFPSTSIVIGRDFDPHYGFYIDLQSGNDYVVRLAHLRVPAFYKVGDSVAPYAQVGISGNSGVSTGAHLHYEVRYKGVRVDPEGYGVSLPECP